MIKYYYYLADAVRELMWLTKASAARRYMGSNWGTVAQRWHAHQCASIAASLHDLLRGI